MLSFEEIKKKVLENNTQVVIFSKVSKEGISSSSILIRALQRLNKNFTLTFFYNLNDSKLTELRNYSKDQIIILDPTKEESLKLQDYNYISKEQKTVSEQCYDLAKLIDQRNKDLIHLTFISLENINNEELIQQAESLNKIKRIRGIKILGSNSRPLHKVVELSMDPFIIGFSGSEEHSLNLFKDTNINLKTADSWTCLMDLNELHIDKLINTLSLNAYSKEELFEQRLIFLDEERNSPFRDLHEFSLFLDACIEYKTPSIGIAKCIASSAFKNRALELLKDYRQDIIKALSLYYTKKDQELITEKENCIIINYKSRISEISLNKTINLIQNSKLYPQKKRIIGLCQTKQEITKCSIFYYNKLDSNIKNLINALPKDFKVFNSENILTIYSDPDLEKKLIELILEHLESARIEEISQ